MKLRLVDNKECFPVSDGRQQHIDHEQLIGRYLQSHKVRNHSVRTIKREELFLKSWFQEHGSGMRPLYTWEAMEPVNGRARILDYANSLIDSGITSATVRSYVGILSRYFSYVLEYPYLIDDRGGTTRIHARYGRIEQPVSEYDIPKHTYDGEKLGIPLDPERLYHFLSIIKKKYLSERVHKAIRARNYTMLVLAGETGLRIDEILNLELLDLFFESKKLQTRHAKGTKGSGKRSRITLFPPLARDTTKFYLKEYRSQLIRVNKSDYLFPSRSGNKLDYPVAHLALRNMVSIAQKNGVKVLPHMSWHWLRRIFATRFIERFPNQLSVLVSLLGHITPNTVHRYIHHSEAWMDQKIQQVLEGSFQWPSIGD